MACAAQALPRKSGFGLRWINSDWRICINRILKLLLFLREKALRPYTSLVMNFSGGFSMRQRTRPLVCWCPVGTARKTPIGKVTGSARCPMPHGSSNRTGSPAARRLDRRAGRRDPPPARAGGADRAQPGLCDSGAVGGPGRAPGARPGTRRPAGGAGRRRARAAPRRCATSRRSAASRCRSQRAGGFRQRPGLQPAARHAPGLAPGARRR